VDLSNVQSNAAYSAIAPFYDDFTSGYDYDAYTATTERLAVAHGVDGRRLLDVACGSGKSLLPPLHRGWTVEGCDSSHEMLALAAVKSGGRARLALADMRALPDGPAADLITCLDDSINYLDSEDDLRDALAGFRRRMAPRGVAVFDLNTRRAYRELFCSTWSRGGQSAMFHWRGCAPARFEATSCATGRLDAELPDGSRRFLGMHRQRHFSRREVASAMCDAGLRLVAAHGLHPDGAVDAVLDEDLHTKAIYVAVALAPRGGE
jgi:SAM-dependent methyltransferase